MLKPYKIERAHKTIKITTIDIVEFDFFYYNGLIYKNTIEAVYILKIFINLISIREFQLDGIIYNGFN